MEQLGQIKQMGPLEDLLGMIPGLNRAGKQLKNLSLDEKQLVQTEAIIQSMTRKNASTGDNQQQQEASYFPGQRDSSRMSTGF